MNPALQSLRQHPAFWGGERTREILSTGSEALDRLLPGGGWPLGALTEILAEQEGIGELSLVVPALARLSREGRWIPWIAPPHLPYAPALAAWGVRLSRVLLAQSTSPSDALWAAEQALRSGACGAVLAWIGDCEGRSLRRLQLAAERGRCWGVLFRPLRFAERPSPAALRLKVGVAPQGVAVQVLKGRGGQGTIPFGGSRAESARYGTMHATPDPTPSPAACTIRYCRA